MKQDNLRQDVIKGLSWTFLNQIITQVISLGLCIILARLLSPDEFGIMAMIVIFTNFARIFVDFGFSTAIIQKRNVTQSNFSTVFWFNIFSGFVLTLIFFLGAESIANFYNKPVLNAVTKVLSITFLISSLTAIQSAKLVKELNFKRQSLINWVTVVISALVAIGLAYKGYGVWSLVVQSLVNSILTAIFYWVYSTWRPSFIFNINDLKDMFRFGGSVAGESIFNYWSRNMDNMLIGKLLGAGPLGIYNRAYSLMLLPVSNITGSITRVMFPALSSIQGDVARTKSIYLKISRTIAFISFPLMFGLCAVCEPFILFVYGKQWAEMIPILRILSALGAFQSVLSLNGVIYNSQGRADLALKVTVILNAILLLTFYIGIKLNGVIGLTWGYFLVASLGALPILYMATKLINTTLLEQAKNLAKIFISTIVMFFLVYFLSKTMFILSLSYLVQLIILVITGLIVYLILVVVLREKVFTESLEGALKNIWLRVKPENK